MGNSSLQVPHQDREQSIVTNDIPIHHIIIGHKSVYWFFNIKILSTESRK